MADDDTLIGARAFEQDAHTFERAAPFASDAIAFAGGIGIAFGVLLLTINFYVHNDGTAQGVLLFAVLFAAGYGALWVLPRETHPAAVTVIVIGVLGTLGWWILPHANRFGEVRPFLILSILAFAGLWFAPRTRGRTIFVAAALLILWLWILGEVAGSSAYSAAPIPSPPAHTTFSFSPLLLKTAAAPALATGRAEVELGDLDQSSPLYPLAVECSSGDPSACDVLFTQAAPGSDFRAFADACGNNEAAGSGGQCQELEGGGNFGGTFSPPTNEGGGNIRNGIVPGVAVGTQDKSLELGVVSLLFGIAYVGALFVFDRRRWHGLGTALVIPGFLALFTGTELLGNAAHHAWLGGLLTFVAGVAFAIVGDFGGRRFSTWAGGVAAAFGAYVFATDATNLSHSVTSDNASLVRPGLTAIGAGLVLVAIALVVAAVRGRLAGPTISLPPFPQPGPPPDTTQPPGPPASFAFPLPPPATVWPPTPPPSGPWQPPT